MRKFILVLLASLLLAAGCTATNRDTTISSNKPYIYGQDPAADSAIATPSTGEQKRQCASDGAAWYKTTVEDQSTPQAIYQWNIKNAGNDPSITIQSIYLGNESYVYSTKLNTCLIDYSETTTYMNGNTFTTHSIVDVYTNKTVAEWDWSQSKGQTIDQAMKASDSSGYNSAEFNLITQQK